jgi:hypothetical protein
MTISGAPSHPVWLVYDEWRTARLSCKYYGAKLSQLERVNFWIELLLAGTASGSAIAAFTFWQTAGGEDAWTILTGISALIAVAKPLLKLTDRIQQLDQISTSYALLDHDYKKLAHEIQQQDVFDVILQQKHRALLDRSDELKKKESIERTINERLRTECREKVELELPHENFYIPMK